MRIGIGQIHQRPSAPMVAMIRRNGGMGDVNALLANWFQSLSAQPPSDAATGCGSGGGYPCGSPVQAAQQVYTQAAAFCAEETDGSFVAGYVADPACSDNGKAAADAIYAQVLSFYEGLPASVWQDEAANAASGNYYGTAPAGPCPAGMFVQVGPNGLTCYGNTAQDAGSVGPPINIQTETPIAATTPVVSTPVQQAPPTQVATPTTALPLIAPAASSSSTTAAGAPASSSSSSTSGTDDFAFLTQSLIAGIPNWALIAGGLAAVLLLPSLLGRR